MRLIDADSLIHLVTDSTILGDGFKTAFCALVNGEPTIKVQKTGHWIPQGKDIECSSCGVIYKKYIHPVCGIYKHCPNCGARMEREEE